MIWVSKEANSREGKTEASVELDWPERHFVCSLTCLLVWCVSDGDVHIQDFHSSTPPCRPLSTMQICKSLCTPEALLSKAMAQISCTVESQVQTCLCCCMARALMHCLIPLGTLTYLGKGITFQESSTLDFYSKILESPLKLDFMCEYVME